VTILRKKFSPPGRRTVGALALEVRPVTTRALFGLGKLGFNLGNPRFGCGDHVGDRPVTSR
jgi:hypothetical protein